MKVAEARMLGVSQHGSPERLLHDAVKVKLDCVGRPHSVGNTSVLVYLPTNSADQSQPAVRNQPEAEREECVAVN